LEGKTSGARSTPTLDPSTRAVLGIAATDLASLARTFPDYAVMQS